MVRKEVTDRFYRLFTYQSVDRAADLEFGYWPQTIRRWLKEGLPAEYASEANKMFSAKLDAFFGLDVNPPRLGCVADMSPAFTEEIIERKASSVVMRGSDGIVAERFLNDVDESSIPHFLDFPVKTPDDWKAMKERYRLDDPIRVINPKDVEEARKSVQAGGFVGLSGGLSIYGKLRDWMGFQNLSMAFYDYPEMIHDMVDHWSEMVVRQVRALPADIPIDYTLWWEDMASNNGPFTSPKMFREFIQPGYHKIMTECRRRGCEIGAVDCDGNPHDIVANWLEEGVNIMFPVEVAAGCDPYAWRKEFGKALRLRGGVGKAPLVIGGAAIDRELERIKPLLGQGGFLPHLDHLVPPDISFKNYMDYLEKKRKMIGK